MTNRIRSFDYYSLQHWFTPTHVTKWVNNGHQITNIFISNFIFIHAIRLHISLQPASYLTLNWISSVLPVSRKILYKPWAVLSRIFEDFCRKIQSNNIPLKCFLNWVQYFKCCCFYQPFLMLCPMTNIKTSKGPYHLCFIQNSTTPLVLCLIICRVFIKLQINKW